MPLERVPLTSTSLPLSPFPPACTSQGPGSSRLPTYIFVAANRTNLLLKYFVLLSLLRSALSLNCPSVVLVKPLCTAFRRCLLIIFSTPAPLVGVKCPLRPLCALRLPRSDCEHPACSRGGGSLSCTSLLHVCTAKYRARGPLEHEKHRYHAEALCHVT